jgi:hypothetical protein
MIRDFELTVSSVNTNKSHTLLIERIHHVLKQTDAGVGELFKKKRT